MGPESGIARSIATWFVLILNYSPINKLLFLAIIYFLIFKFLNRKFNRFNRMWVGFKIFLALALASLVYLLLAISLALYFLGD